MIYKGDIVRLFNPSEIGLTQKPHMHLVTNKIDGKDVCERELVVGTTTPTRYIMQGIEFEEVEGKPFKEKTYIRLDPIYSLKNVKIKLESRTPNIHKLSQSKEDTILSKIQSASILELDRDEFSKLNYKYAIPVNDI